MARLAIIIFLLAQLTGLGCRSTPEPQNLARYDFTSPHMGTLFKISLLAADKSQAKSAADAAFQRIAELDNIMSDYQADSELMTLCDKPYGKPVVVSEDLFAVLQQAQKISDISNGAFDVTVGPYVRLWRFARKRKTLPTPEEIATAGKSVGYQKLRLSARDRAVTLLAPNMKLDLGGIAKGYAADQALKLLKLAGFGRALVAASGDLAAGSPPPGKAGWRVGITDIDVRDDQVGRTILLRNAGISTSGDTEQFVEIGGVRYSHIVDPHTGLGLTNRIQASIVARSSTTTDALATTICVLGAERGLKLIDKLPRTAAFVLEKKDGAEEQHFSKNWNATVRSGAP
jgi:thiamine biosynthesis lipoprotein